MIRLERVRRGATALALRTLPPSTLVRGTLVRGTLLCGALSVLSALPAHAAFAALVQDEKEKDTIHLKGGKSETGRIASEDHAGVALEGRGSSARVIPWDTVVSIEYADAPELSEALSSLSAGKLDDALTQLRALQAEEKLRPVVQQQVLYHIALIHQKSGRLEEAIAAWRALLEAFPKSRYLRIAGEGLVACLLAQQDPAGAAKAVETLGATAKDVEGFAGELALLEGRVLEAQEKLDEALAKYDAAEKSAGAATAVVLEAQVARARCLALQGKFAEAEQICRKITLEEAPRSVLAGAWNGIGDAWAEEGRQKKDSDKLLEALFAYMRGVVQYAPLPGEPTSEHERALAGAARCFRFISQLEQTPERKRLYEERARARLEQLAREFPTSLYIEDTRPTETTEKSQTSEKK